MLKMDLDKRLEDVPEDKHFHAANGTVVKNLLDLDLAIEHMGEETFRMHVSDVRNDFVNWVMEVIDDQELAAEILKAKSRRKTQILILRRVVNILRKKC